jgi:hypothetical protein
MELTLEELTKNMCKGDTNYNRLVRVHAYHTVMSYNEMVKDKKKIIQEAREYHKQNPNCITHPDYIKYYDRKKRKSVYYTIYTKAPRFRTYRQQCVITAKQLETTFRIWLQARDSRKIYNFYH